MDGRPGGRESEGVREENKGRRTGGIECVGGRGKQKMIKEIKNACREGREGMWEVSWRNTWVVDSEGEI